MKKSEQIKEWLLLVNRAQQAVVTVKAQAMTEDVNAEYELRQASEQLDSAFEYGLEAHGKAILAEHLAGEVATVA